MIHGHGTPQGVYFSHAGVRTSEDTAILLSPKQIQTFVLPYTERAVASFGGCFVHYCGLHQPLFQQLCRSPYLRAIDLGNSEKYDPRWLCECCGESGVVLYSRIAEAPDEEWPAYIARLAGLVQETGAALYLAAIGLSGVAQRVRRDAGHVA